MRDCTAVPPASNLVRRPQGLLQPRWQSLLVDVPSHRQQYWGHQEETVPAAQEMSRDSGLVMVEQLDPP